MIGRQIVYLRDFAEEAAKLRQDYGYTRMFSTGIAGLDGYLGGGYGRRDGYEVVLLFGPTKIGKSVIALNFLKAPIAAGEKVGIMTLEDAGADVFIRLENILGNAVMRERVFTGNTVQMMPPDDLVKSWKLSELLEMIEDWFTTRDLDLILLDHLQFAFEGAEAIKGENEYIAQRVFMQKLNQLMKRVKKTIILISHVNKDSSNRGTNKVMGSGSIPQAATKLLEVGRDGNEIQIRMWGSRFTYTPPYEYVVQMNGMNLERKIVDARQQLPV